MVGDVAGVPEADLDRTARPVGPDEFDVLGGALRELVAVDLRQPEPREPLALGGAIGIEGGRRVGSGLLGRGLLLVGHRRAFCPSRRGPLRLPDREQVGRRNVVVHADARALACEPGMTAEFLVAAPDPDGIPAADARHVGHGLGRGRHPLGCLPLGADPVAGVLDAGAVVQHHADGAAIGVGADALDLSGDVRRQGGPVTPREVIPVVAPALAPCPDRDGDLDLDGPV